MPEKLWEANLSLKNNSNLFKFEKFISKKYRYKPSKNYKKLFKWSIKNLNYFWSSVWDFAKVKGKKIDRFYFTKDILKNKFFVKSKLNFAENLLSKKDKSKAITFISETGFREKRSWKELYENTSICGNNNNKLSVNRCIDMQRVRYPQLIQTMVSIHILFHNHQKKLIFYAL